MRHLKLTIAYNGENYVGWQVQKNGITIQQRLEEGWLEVTGESIRIIASGRTDSGVHARAQVCSLATNSRLPNDHLRRALNAKTPEDISVLKVETAIEGFNAIADCSHKTYGYYIQCGRILDPILRHQAWFVPHHLDIDAMREAAAMLTGQHDFASFQAAGGTVRSTTVRNIMELSIDVTERWPFTDVRIGVTADGFLYNMVRNIVGTLVHVGRRSEPAKWVQWALEQQDRIHAGQTAPAHALFLEEVCYPPGTVLNSEKQAEEQNEGQAHQDHV